MQSSVLVALVLAAAGLGVAIVANSRRIRIVGGVAIVTGLATLIVTRPSLAPLDEARRQEHFTCDFLGSGVRLPRSRARPARSLHAARAAPVRVRGAGTRDQPRRGHMFGSEEPMREPRWSACKRGGHRRAGASDRRSASHARRLCRRRCREVGRVTGASSARPRRPRSRCRRTSTAHRVGARRLRRMSHICSANASAAPRGRERVAGAGRDADARARRATRA